MSASTAHMMNPIATWDVAWNAWAWHSENAHENADQPLIGSDVAFCLSHV